MEASEPKLVNPDLSNMGLTQLDLEALIYYIKFCFVYCVKIEVCPAIKTIKTGTKIVLINGNQYISETKIIYQKISLIIISQFIIYHMIIFFRERSLVCTVKIHVKNLNFTAKSTDK